MKRIFPVFILGTLLAGGCSPKNKAPQAAIPKITITSPEQREVLEYEDVPGRIEAIENVEIKARVTGFLTKVAFKEGTEVKAGALLYTIDPREYQAEYDSAVAAWQQTQARLSQARSDYERAKQLSKSTVIAAQELETRGTDVRAVEAQVRAAEASVNKTKLNLEFTQISAPITGKISRTSVTEGNLVKDGDTLTSIVSQDPVYVYLDAPERVILRWDKIVKNNKTTGNGGNLVGRAKVSVGLLNEDGFPREGHVDFSDNELNTGTGTLQLRAILPNSDRSLRVGLYARVRLSLDQPKQSLLIPERAVGVDQGQRFVYIVNKENKVEYRKVVVGQIYEGKLAVLEGLQPEDRVIMEGLQMLRPGQVIQPIDIHSPEAAAATLPVANKQG